MTMQIKRGVTLGDKFRYLMIASLIISLSATVYVDRAWEKLPSVYAQIKAKLPGGK